MFRDYLFDYFAELGSSEEHYDNVDFLSSGSSNLTIGGFNPNTYRRFPRHALTTGPAIGVSIVCMVVLTMILALWECRKRRQAARTPESAGEIKGIGGLYLAVFLDSYGVTMTIPYLAILLVQFQCTAFQATMLGTVFAFTQTVGTLILGALADYINKKYILTMTLGFCSVSLGLCGVCTLLPTGKESDGEDGINFAYLGLLVARGVAGFFASTVSIIETLIAEQSTEETRTENIAQVMGYFMLGAMAGPAIGGFVYDWGFEVLCYSSATITFVNAVWAALTIDTSNPVEGSKASERETQQKKKGQKGESPIGDACKALQRHPTIYLLLFATVWATGAPALSMAVGQLFVLQVYQWGPLQIAGCSLVAGICGVWAQLALAGRVTTKFGDAGSIVLGNMIRCAGNFGFLIISPVTPWVLLPVAAGTGAMINAQLQSLLTVYSPPQSLGTLFGIMQAMRSFGEGIAPPIGGYMLDMDLMLPFKAMGLACAFCGLLVTPFIFKKPDPPEESNESQDALEEPPKEPRARSALSWKQRVQQAQLHTVSYLHARLTLYPTLFVIERLHPEFRDTYIIKRSQNTTIKVFLCFVLSSFVPAGYSFIKNFLRIPLLPFAPSIFPSTQVPAGVISCICGPLFTLSFSIYFWRKLKSKRFQYFFFGFFKDYLPSLFYNGLGPWGDPTSAKFMLQDAYRWQHDLFGGTDLVVLSVSMAIMMILTTAIVGFMDTGATGLIFGFLIGLAVAYLSFIPLDTVLGASSELVLYVNTELKTFQPHWKLLGYGTDPSEIRNKDPNLKEAVNAAANLFDKLATVSEAANLYDGRVYDHYVLETAFDMKAVSLLSNEEHRNLRQISHLIREQGVEILQRLVLWLQKHSTELTFSQKACWKLFTASSKCDMDVFACDEYTLATLSFLDIETFLGVFFDTRFELLEKLGWSPEHLLQRVFVANPQQFLYELDTSNEDQIWCLTASLDTYLAGEQLDDSPGEKVQKQISREVRHQLPS